MFALLRCIFTVHFLFIRAKLKANKIHCLATTTHLVGF